MIGYWTITNNPPANLSTCKEFEWCMVSLNGWKIVEILRSLFGVVWTTFVTKFKWYYKKRKKKVYICIGSFLSRERITFCVEYFFRSPGRCEWISKLQQRKLISQPVHIFTPDSEAIFKLVLYLKNIKVYSFTYYIFYHKTSLFILFLISSNVNFYANTVSL